jgi:M6 family metalloprotease-like protein
MKTAFLAWQRAFLAVALLDFLMTCERLKAATLADFGYGHRTENNHLPSGGRPLLVIMACFDSNGPSECFANYEHDWTFYHNLIFGSANSPISMNGYFEENSNARFWWVPVATELGPTAGITKVWVNSSGCLECPGMTEIAYYSNLVAHAMQSVNFANYDSDHNGVVTMDEMAIAIINSDFKSGGTRNAGHVPGPQAAFQGLVSNLGYFVTFDTWCHELSHSLGTLDLYGTNCASEDVTLMSCTSPFANSNSFHLDPWHKMQFGWTEPRIRELSTGGAENISAAQLMDPQAPIILYDAARGTSEFFMLEYRTPNSPIGPGYDKDVANEALTTNGLAIWRIKQNANHDPACTAGNSPVCIGGNPIVWTDGAPSLLNGGSALWSSDVTTPLLRFEDGTSTGVKIHVRPFANGDGVIRVEWLFPKDTWVDFNYVGSENGSFSSPFNTAGEGVLASSYGGTLHFKTGSHHEAVTFAKRSSIQTYNGPVIIGR